MSLLADVPVLHGSLVRLEPLSVSHGTDLAVAAEEDRGAYGFTIVPRAWGNGGLSPRPYRAGPGRPDGAVCPDPPR
jgi:hypothetical protein